MTPLEGQPQVAAENGGTDDGQRRRPDPLRWIWYAFGGALGPRYRQWVLHDLTCRTRWERQIARAVVQVVPLALVLFLVLGFGWVVWVGVGCGLVLALIYSTAYFDSSADYRLVKHGYPPAPLSGSSVTATRPSIPIGCVATCRLIAPTRIRLGPSRIRFSDRHSRAPRPPSSAQLVKGSRQWDAIHKVLRSC